MAPMVKSVNVVYWNRRILHHLAEKWW